MNQTAIPENCTNCGSELDANGKFCKECGTSIQSMVISQSVSSELFCPNCKQSVGADDKFCRYCALDLIKSLEETQPIAEPITPPTPLSQAQISQAQSIPLQVQPIPSLVELNVQSHQEKYSHSSQSEFASLATDLQSQQTENAPDNPASLISPSGAALAVICFFLPWMKISQCGITKTVSGAEVATFDGSFWLFPLMGIVSVAAYFMCKNQKQLWRARPFILISSGFALFLLFYKYNSIPSSPEIMGQRITAADMGITLELGGYGTVIGFVLAIIGCAFMIYQNQGVLPTVNSQKFSDAMPTAFEFSSGKLKSNIAAMLCYVLSAFGMLFFPLSIIFCIAFQVFLLNSKHYKKNRLICFHSYQSIFLVLGYFLVTFLLIGLVIAFSNQASLLNPSSWSNLQFVGLISIAFNLAYLGLSIFMAVKGYQKQMYQLPYIGDWAMQRVGIIESENTESVSSTTAQYTLIPPPIQPNPDESSYAPSYLTKETSNSESNNPRQTKIIAETFEPVFLGKTSSEKYIDDFGISKQTKTVIGIGLGVTALLVGIIGIFSSNAKTERTDANAYTPYSSNSSYITNSSSFDSTNSYYSTNSMSNSSMVDQTNQSEVAVNSYSISTNSSSVSSSSKKGHLVTDSNIRDVPNKDAYSVGIHYKDAKVEVLDETSYETDGKVSTWYKVRVTEYGCSKDSNLGCGKNSGNDSDEGWVNAKIVLITDGSNSTTGEQRTFQQPRKIENYFVRIYNVDDTATVYVNGSEVLMVPYSRVENSDITGSLRPGNNEVRFVLKNSGKEFTYGFEVFKDNKSIFKDECGVIGKFGCGGSFQTGLVYDRTITVMVDSR